MTPFSIMLIETLILCGVIFLAEFMTSRVLNELRVVLNDIRLLLAERADITVPAAWHNPQNSLPTRIHLPESFKSAPDEV